MTQWFVLPRFGSCKPTPRWGGHKDRVSFNPFPLSNVHLDRVSFSPQSNGSLKPHKDHHTIGVSCFDYKCLENENGEEKSDPSDKNSNEHENLSLTSHYLFGVIFDLGENLISWLCLGVKSRALVLNAMTENLDALKWWLGVFIAPITKPTVGVGLLSMGAPDSPVRQPRHPTIRVRPLELWQLGAQDSPVRLLAPVLTLRELSAHCSAFQVNRWSRSLRCSRCSVGTPDSPVAH
jgi:hypothetical protein